jgi:uncharacterized membrane protein
MARGAADALLANRDETQAMPAHVGWYQILMIFFLWSIIGLFLEEGWVFISMGLEQSRPGLVWGPFSPIYGFGAVLLTVVLRVLERGGASTWRVFFASMLVGGLLEQTTGWVIERWLGAVSWDYIAGGIPGALTKWVALPFLFAWGALGCLWGQVVLPCTLRAVGEPTTRLRVVFASVLAVFLVADILVTLSCFDRVAEREADIPPANRLEELVDEAFDDEFVARRFQNLELNGR